LYGACTAAHLGADSRSTITVVGSYTVQGNSGNHYRTSSGAGIFVANDGNPLTVSIIGTPSFSSAFALGTTLAYLSCPSSKVAFAGSATGVRYLVIPIRLLKPLVVVLTSSLVPRRDQ
jgi:hypothetical protein